MPSASRPPPGIGGLGAPETGGKRLLTGLGNLTSSIDTLEATISKPKPTPKDAGGAPGAFRPIVKAVSEQRTELNNIENALVTLKGTSADTKDRVVEHQERIGNAQHQLTTQTSAQTAELGNIKNATATLNTTTYAGLVASTAAVTAGNMLSMFQSAAQVTRRGHHDDSRQQHHDGSARRGYQHGQRHGERRQPDRRRQSTRSTCPST